MFVMFLHCKIYSYFLLSAQCSLEGGVLCTAIEELEIIILQLEGKVSI